MDATYLDAFADALIDELVPVSPEDDVGPSLGRLVDCPRPVVDDFDRRACSGVAGG
ncbi:hypothetical protein [Mycolicibacterium neoaurum]|uniref:hypothetical protein n=1 Tax=Mycolicibacterium neoaurum TaxID=1795 RepID=UPI0019D554FA|nr:hypothetical protein [Mycolicibacterium neoaurum]